MLADYSYYTDEFHGFTIPEEQYAYFADRAADQLSPYVARIERLANENATSALKKCSCALAEALCADFSATKGGSGAISSESVSGYYSVSYGALATDANKVHKLNDLVKTYLGMYILGPISIQI